MSADLDRAVAERLGWTEIAENPAPGFGWRGTSPRGHEDRAVPAFSTDWRATGWLIERYGIGVELMIGGGWLAIREYGGSWTRGYADTPQEAVCRLIAEHGVPS